MHYTEGTARWDGGRSIGQALLVAACSCGDDGMVPIEKRGSPFSFYRFTAGWIAGWDYGSSERTGF